MKKKTEILLIEDNPGDIRLVEEGFKRIQTDISLTTVKDGKKAIDLLQKRKNSENELPPDIIILDLNMPRKSGYKVLEEIKNDSELEKIPSIVLTSSDAEEDVNKSYSLCANSYIIKPVDPNEFIGLIEKFEEFWLKSAKIPSPKNNMRWNR